MSHTVVSVVIPALNAAGTLPAQLEALARQDTDVPWEVSLRLAKALRSPSVHLTLVKDGDHRLSRDHDIALLLGVLATI